MEATQHTARRLATGLCSASLAGLLYLLLGGRLKLWSNSGPEIPISAGTVALTALLIVCALAHRDSRFRGLASPSLESSLGFAAGLVLIFASDWMGRGYNFFQGPLIRGELIVCSLFFLLIARSGLWWLIYAFVPLAAIFLMQSYLDASGGRLLFSDDHPVFLYRLELLKLNFPSIPFYHPLWNGGIDARDFFATGSLNFFLLHLPWIYLFDLQSSYTLLVGGTLFAFVPLCMYFAARAEELPPPAPAIAALLSLCTGFLWYRWSLSYGTMGFIVTSSLLPLNLVLAAKLVSRDEPLSRLESWVFPVTFSMMLLWSPSGLVFLPIALIGLFNITHVIRKERALAVILALLLINLPWICMFWTVSNVGKFLHSEKASAAAEGAATGNGQGTAFRHRKGRFDLAKSLTVLREGAISTNPLLLFLAVPGLLRLRRRSRLAFPLTAAWLLVLGTVVVPIKPQLEFDRMLVVLSACLCLPASHTLAELTIRARSTGLVGTLLIALTGGYLLLSPFASAVIASNRSAAPVYFSTDLLGGMAEAIDRFGGDGRTMFSGFVLHELNHGHLAPLVFYTSKPLMASSHVHNKWAYEDIIPNFYLGQGEAGITRYLDLYNVSAVMAHEAAWQRYFEDRPANFELAWQSGKFKLYRRRAGGPGYFEQGQGALISQSTNKIVVRVDEPDAVLKFNYFPFLESSACKLEPAPFPGDVTFLKLSACPVGTEITIDSVSPSARIMHGPNR